MKQLQKTKSADPRQTLLFGMFVPLVLHSAVRARVVIFSMGNLTNNTHPFTLADGSFSAVNSAKHLRAETQ